MSWVRYDDGFDCNPKVTAVIADNPAAIALHLLARTWTARQKRPGYVPLHQPGVLVASKPLGEDWAAILVKHELWHLPPLMCAVCLEATTGWPAEFGGFVIHEWWKYDAPTRERTTPGTPSALSEKRREAGRAGGLKSGQTRRSKQNVRANEANDVTKNGSNLGRPSEANEANPEANSEANGHSAGFATDFASFASTPETASDLRFEANGATKRSTMPANGVTPVPVPVTTDTPNGVSVADKPRRHEATEPLAGMPSSLPPTETARAQEITRAYAAAEPMCKFPAVLGIVRKAIQSKRYTDDEIRDGLLRLAKEGRGVTVETLRTELDGFPARSQKSTTDDRVAHVRALKEQARQRREGTPPNVIQGSVIDD